MYDNPIGYAHVVKDFVRVQADEAKRTGRLPGSAGFIVSSFLHSGFDKDTGEIFKDTWDAEFECERIRKYLNYRQVYLSRMPEETSGAFWDATIYSPRGKMKLSLPLKEGLDPSKYGGYSSEKYAYFFCYYAKDKKGKRLIDFAPVPVSRAAGGQVDIEAFGREVAEERGYAFESIARAKIAIKQLIEVDGCRLFITGADQVRSAVPLAFGQEETHLVERLLSGAPVGPRVRDSLFNQMMVGIRRFDRRLYDNLKLDDRSAAFERLGEEDKDLILKGLLALSSASNNMADMRPIGGAKTAGQLKIVFRNVLSNQGITFIDQSVTGMFERKTYIGL